MKKNNQKIGIGVFALLVVVALCIVPVSANIQHSSGNSGTFSFTQGGGIVENAGNSGSVFLGSQAGYFSNNGNVGTIGGFQTMQADAIEIGNTSCDLPGPVAGQSVQVSVSIDVESAEGFTGSTYNASLSRGAHNVLLMCNEVETIGNVRTYNCTADYGFWFPPGAYDLYFEYNVGLEQTIFEEQSVCTYGQLIAGQRETNTVSFANSGTNVQSNQAFHVRNVGNMPIDVTVRAYDLFDGSQIALPASNFQMGETQQTATTLVDSTYIAISQIQPGENSTKSFWMWANIVPTANPPFRATNAWQMLAVGE